MQKLIITNKKQPIYALYLKGMLICNGVSKDLIKKRRPQFTHIKFMTEIG